MKQRFVAKRILRLLSRRGTLPGLTLGDIAKSLHLHAGTAVHQRITELRKRGWDIKTHHEGREWRYYVLTRERQRIAEQEQKGKAA